MAGARKDVLPPNVAYPKLLQSQVKRNLLPLPPKKQENKHIGLLVQEKLKAGKNVNKNKSSPTLTKPKIP